MREQLVQAFPECGLPEAMLMDHGTPWWSASSAGGWTQCTIGRMYQGVRLYLSGIRHPQTQGFSRVARKSTAAARPDPHENDVWRQQGKDVSELDN